MKKFMKFWRTDVGKITSRCIIAGILMSGIDWYYDDWRELAWGVVLIVGFVICELYQHGWEFLRMEKQSWREWIYPAIVILIIYAT